MSDLKLAETVSSALAQMIEGDVVKNIIQKQLEVTVSDIVSDTLRSYSDFGKVIKDKVNEVVLTAASNVELPEYNKFISDMVVAQFDKVLKEQAQQQLKTLIESELGELPKGEVSCEKLQEVIVSNFASDDYSDEKEISVNAERNNNGLYLTIKNEDGCEEIKVTLYNHGNEDHLFQIGYIDTGSYRELNSRISKLALNTYCMSKLERFLFRLYCAQTKINIKDLHCLESFNIEPSYDY